MIGIDLVRIVSSSGFLNPTLNNLTYSIFIIFFLALWGNIFRTGDIVKKRMAFINKQRPEGTVIGEQSKDEYHVR